MIDRLHRTGSDLLPAFPRFPALDFLAPFLPGVYSRARGVKLQTKRRTTVARGIDPPRNAAFRSERAHRERKRRKETGSALVSSVSRSVKLALYGKVRARILPYTEPGCSAVHGRNVRDRRFFYRVHQPRPGLLSPVRFASVLFSFEPRAIPAILEARNSQLTISYREESEIRDCPSLCSDREKI